MITIEEIKAAHAKVKSGADFPNYIKELKSLGLVSYTTYVNNGRTLFYDTDGSQTTLPEKYEIKNISSESNATRFKERLKIHQNGQTDYATFCNDCAATGIEKWIVNAMDMTCVYYDLAGNKVLVEQIPGM